MKLYLLLGDALKASQSFRKRTTPVPDIRKQKGLDQVKCLVCHIMVKA